MNSETQCKHSTTSRARPCTRGSEKSSSRTFTATSSVYCLLNSPSKAMCCDAAIHRGCRPQKNRSGVVAASEYHLQKFPLRALRLTSSPFSKFGADPNQSKPSCPGSGGGSAEVQGTTMSADADSSILTSRCPRNCCVPMRGNKDPSRLLKSSRVSSPSCRLATISRQMHSATSIGNRTTAGNESSNTIPTRVLRKRLTCAGETVSSSSEKLIENSSNSSSTKTNSS
mmetsp:Transcript_36911/g.82996  ORF Transcript_36911/g.82996 Transcript_36911/m.82996 type:complete len:227 (-) Transcript_36911:516-1196(-)